MTTQYSHRKLLVLTAFVLLAGPTLGCSTDDGPAQGNNATVDTGSDAGQDVAPGTDATDLTDIVVPPGDTQIGGDTSTPGDASQDAGEDSGEPGEPNGLARTLPVPGGVVYVGHYHSTDLRIFRTDGDTPRAQPALELGDPTHSMALDSENGLLAVLSDAGRKVRIFSLSRVSDPAVDVAQPTLEATIDYTGVPQFVRFNPATKRLFVVESPQPTGGIVENYFLHVYDLSDPASPKALGGGEPYTIPVTTAFDIDSWRNLLILVGFTTRYLHAYDLSGDGFEPLRGEPLQLEVLFPEQHPNSRFLAGRMNIDPVRNRVYVARSHSVNSELMALEYPSAIPGANQRYGDYASLEDFSVVPDYFDPNVPTEFRANLLMAYNPMLDLATGTVFFVAGAWNGTAATALVVPMPYSDLDAARGCGDYEDFGCFYRNYFEGTAGTYAATDGAGCVDWSNRVVVGTSIDPLNETQPGSLHMYRYDADLNMEPWLTVEGRNFLTGGLPIEVVCH